MKGLKVYNKSVKQYFLWKDILEYFLITKYCFKENIHENKNNCCKLLLSSVAIIINVAIISLIKIDM